MTTPIPNYSRRASPTSVKDAERKFWTMYNEEAQKYDEALTNSWKGDMDSILIFAGLFSAVLTAFIIEAYQKLQLQSDDQTVDILNRLLQVQTLMAAGNSSDVSSMATPGNSPDFKPSTSVVVCNALWFLSLFFSLTSALAATLVQRWVRSYLQDTRQTSPILHAKIRIYLYDGIDDFRMRRIVSIIPTLLHISLFLFYAGVIAFFHDISAVIFGLHIAIISSLLLAYATTTVLPLFYRRSPFNTPLTSFCWWLCGFLFGQARTSINRSNNDHDADNEETTPKESPPQGETPRFRTRYKAIFSFFQQLFRTAQTPINRSNNNDGAGNEEKTLNKSPLQSKTSRFRTRYIAILLFFQQLFRKAQTPINRSNNDGDAGNEEITPNTSPPQGNTSRFRTSYKTVLALFQQLFRKAQILINRSKNVPLLTFSSNNVDNEQITPKESLSQGKTSRFRRLYKESRLDAAREETEDNYEREREAFIWLASTCFDDSELEEFLELFPLTYQEERGKAILRSIFENAPQQAYNLPNRILDLFRTCNKSALDDMHCSRRVKICTLAIEWIISIKPQMEEIEKWCTDAYTLICNAMVCGDLNTLECSHVLPLFVTLTHLGSISKMLDKIAAKYKSGEILTNRMEFKAGVDWFHRCTNLIVKGLLPGSKEFIVEIALQDCPFEYKIAGCLQLITVLLESLREQVIAAFLGSADSRKASNAKDLAICLQIFNSAMLELNLNNDSTDDVEKINRSLNNILSKTALKLDSAMFGTGLRIFNTARYSTFRKYHIIFSQIHKQTTFLAALLVCSADINSSIQFESQALQKAMEHALLRSLIHLKDIFIPLDKQDSDDVVQWVQELYFRMTSISEAPDGNGSAYPVNLPSEIKTTVNNIIGTTAGSSDGLKHFLNRTAIAIEKEQEDRITKARELLVDSSKTPDVKSKDEDFDVMEKLRDENFLTQFFYEKSRKPSVAAPVVLDSILESDESDNDSELIETTSSENTQKPSRKNSLHAVESISHPTEKENATPTSSSLNVHPEEPFEQDSSVKDNFPMPNIISTASSTQKPQAAQELSNEAETSNSEIGTSSGIPMESITVHARDGSKESFKSQFGRGNFE